MEDTKQLPPQPKQVVETEQQVRVARFTPDGKTLVAGGYDGRIHRWDFSADPPRSLEPLTGHHGWVESLGFHPHEPRMFSVDSWGQLAAWDIAADTPQHLWSVERAHDGWIRSLGVSHDGRLLATAGKDRLVRVWSSEDGSPRHEFSGHEHEVYCVAAHPDGQSVVSGDLMGNLHHWNLADGKCLRAMRLESMHFYDRIQDVAGLRILQFADDGKTLICAGSDPTKAGRMFGIPSIRLLDWETLKTRHELKLGPDKNGFVFDLSWHPDGFFMLVTSGPPGAGQFVFWRPGDEKPFFEHTKMFNTHSLAVHLESRRLVVTATNRNSQGNGAVLDKQGNYLPNTSPLHVFELPAHVG